MMGGNQSTPNYNDPKYDRNYVQGGGGAPAYNPNYDANRGPIQGTPNYPSGNPYQASAHGTYNSNGGSQGTYNTPAYGGYNNNNGSNQGTMNEGGYGPSYAGTGNLRDAYFYLLYWEKFPQYAPSGPGQNPWNSGTANAVPGTYNNNNNSGNYGGAPAFNPNGDNNGNRNW